MNQEIVTGNGNSKDCLCVDFDHIQKDKIFVMTGRQTEAYTQDSDMPGNDDRKIATKMHKDILPGNRCQ